MPLPSLSMTLAIQVAKTLAGSRQQDLLPSQTGKTHRTTRTSRSLEFRLHAGLASWPLMSAWKEKPKPPWDADQTRRFYLVGRTADTRHSTEHLCGCVCVVQPCPQWYCCVGLHPRCRVPRTPFVDHQSRAAADPGPQKETITPHTLCSTFVTRPNQTFHPLKRV